MNYPHSIPVWRANGELLPGNAPYRIVLSSVGTKWNDVVLEQRQIPSSERPPCNVQAACDCYQYWPVHYSGIQERGAVSALLQGKRPDFLPEPSAFFWLAESREGRVCGCSLSGSGAFFRKARC